MSVQAPAEPVPVAGGAKARAARDGCIRRGGFAPRAAAGPVSRLGDCGCPAGRRHSALPHRPRSWLTLLDVREAARRMINHLHWRQLRRMTPNA